MKCEICNKEFSALKSLSKHLKFIHHIDKQSYYNNYLLKSPLDGYCITCGKPTTFLGLHGYKNYCNSSCAQRDPNIIAKIHTAEHENNVSIGVKRTYTKEQGQKRIATTRKNLLAKYGVTNPAQLPYTKAKFKETLNKEKEQFCKQHNCTPKQTLIKLYGQGWLKLPISYLFNKRVAYVKNSDIILIQKYVQSYYSAQENYIYQFLIKIYDGIILRNIQNVITSERIELDFYLPDLNLAIEYNSSYWHRFEKTHDEYYHYNKSKLCWLQSIRLIHIYEFEDLDEQLKLLKDLIYYGFDNYDSHNHNKMFTLDEHIPSIIYQNNNITIYGA